MIPFYVSEMKRHIELPYNCIYTDNDHNDKLSVYGRGYVDGMLDAWNARAKHDSVKILEINASSTRRAYVTGYHDGYDTEQNRKLFRTGD